MTEVPGMPEEGSRVDLQYATIPALLRSVAQDRSDAEVVVDHSCEPVMRMSYAELLDRVNKLAAALISEGVQKGDRIATFAMNHHRHLAAWYGAIGFGGVIHTVNVRLFDEDLIYIMNHAEDKVLMYDAMFQPIIDRLKPHLKTVEHYVIFDRDDSYSAFIAAQDGNYEWATGDERDACMLCYTSGTTGNPKGVLYQHRSTVLHAMAEIAPSIFDLSPQAVLLPIVPMFHAANWGLPFAGAASGVKFMFSTTNDAATLHGLMLQEASRIVQACQRSGLRCSHIWMQRLRRAATRRLANCALLLLAVRPHRVL